MKKKRVSVEQIFAVLKHAKIGMPVADVTWQMEGLAADLLPLKKALCWPAVGSGAVVQATA